MIHTMHALCSLLVWIGSEELPEYFPDDCSSRVVELLNTSEELRQIILESQRTWHVDQPSQMIPERIHGGIQ